MDVTAAMGLWARSATRPLDPAAPLLYLHVQSADPEIMRRVTDGLEPATFGATIRCRPFQCVLVCPAIGLIYGVFGDFGECVCPLRTTLYQPGCSTVAVRSRSSLGTEDEATDVGDVCARRA